MTCHLEMGYKVAIIFPERIGKSRPGAEGIDPLHQKITPIARIDHSRAVQGTAVSIERLSIMGDISQSIMTGLKLDECLLYSWSTQT